MSRLLGPERRGVAVAGRQKKGVLCVTYLSCETGRNLRIIPVLQKIRVTQSWETAKNPLRSTKIRGGD